MNIYIVYEMNYADFETGLDDNISFCGAYKNKRKAMRKAKELMKKAQKDNLYIVPLPAAKRLRDIFAILITEAWAIPYRVTAQKAMYGSQK